MNSGELSIDFTTFAVLADNCEVSLLLAPEDALFRMPLTAEALEAVAYSHRMVTKIGADLSSILALCQSGYIESKPSHLCQPDLRVGLIAKSSGRTKFGIYYSERGLHDVEGVMGDSCFISSGQTPAAIRRFARLAAL